MRCIRRVVSALRHHSTTDQRQRCAIGVEAARVTVSSRAHQHADTCTQSSSKTQAAAGTTQVRQYAPASMSMAPLDARCSRSSMSLALDFTCVFGLDPRDEMRHHGGSSKPNHTIHNRKIAKRHNLGSRAFGV